MKRKYILAVFLAIAFVSMAAWEIYVDFFASRAAIVIITIYQLDKLAHLAGGAFIAGFVLLILDQSRARTILLATVIGALLWEAFELVLDPKVIYLFEKERSLWLQDSLGDLAAGLLGAVLFFVLWRRMLS